MSATLSDVAEQTSTRKAPAKKQRNPEGLAIRVFRDGSVYPSAELVEKFQLEYTDKSSPFVGYGFDVIDTNLYPHFATPKRILLVNPVSRNQPKVDLFASTTYEETGKPKASVLDQGAKTFGMDELIPLVEDIYGLTFYKPAMEAKDGTPAQAEVAGAEYVDLVLVANPATGLPWAKSITNIPKKVSRGKNAGQVTTQRRENTAFYALVPLSSIQPVADGDAQNAAQLADNQQEAEDVEVEAAAMAVSANPFE